MILAGEIKRKVALKGLLVSKGARAAIEAAGGSVELPAPAQPAGKLKAKAAASEAPAASKQRTEPDWLLRFHARGGSKMGDLKRRLLFLLGALIVFRIGVASSRCRASIRTSSPSCSARSAAASSTCSTCSRAARCRASRIFALGIMPYISASIIMQLMTVVSPTLEALKKEGESGRRKITQYTRYGTVGLALFQAHGHRDRAGIAARPRGRAGPRVPPDRP